MSNPIPAIYEDGVLRPLMPISLTEKTRVEIYVQPVVTTPMSEHRRQVRNALAKAKLTQPAPPSDCASHMSAERREELARLFAPGKPLSEIIITERE